MKTYIRLLGLVLLISLLATACGGAQPAATQAPATEKPATEQPAAEKPAEQPAAEAKKNLQICFAFQDLETEFWMAGHKAIIETLKAKGYDVIEVNSNEDANKQLEQVKNCIAQQVDGIMVIPVDGSIALKLIAEANKADIPIGIFNRPPQSDEGNALTVVANNEKIAQSTVEYMAEEAKKLGRKVQPLIMVGDLGDPNAVGRKKGFYDVIEKYPDLFEKPIEVATKWDAATAQAGLQAAMTANPNVDMLFTSSDFLYPTIQGVLEPMGKWKPVGEEGHVIMGGLDGDKTACGLMNDKYVDATGVQDLYFEADALLKAVTEAVSKGEKQPDAWLDDPGFALIQGNMAEREMDMWGCKLYHEAMGDAAAPAAEAEAAAPADDAAAAPVSAEGKKICFAFQDLETEFWMAGHKAIVETLQAQGVEVIEVNSNEDANKQLEQVKNCIAQQVDGIMVIPVDGSIALKLIAEANKADIPIGIFNRPPQSDEGNALTVVANNEKIAEAAVEYMAQEAQKLGRKVQPLIMVGDLGDPNAVGRKKGFYSVIEKYPDLFEKPIEVATKWDAATAQAGLQAAMTANPNVDLLFTSSDFLYPTIQGVLEPMGKWKKMGEEGHVIMGGLDGDKTACGLMNDKFVDATGVQDLYFEADALLKAIVGAVAKGEKQPDAWLDDPGFALTQGNMAEREMDMWGCKLYHEEKGDAAAPAAKAEAAAPADVTGANICFAFQDLETEFWMAGHKAIIETLQANGANVIEVNSNEDANKQLEQVKNCIAQQVDGIMVIPVDGSIALKLIAEANKADIPIGIFNRPPQSDEGNALTVVANNEKIAQSTVEYMAEEAKKLGRKVQPLIMVGDLGDPNAVGRKKGFYDVIEKYPDLFEKPIEVATKWDAATAQAGLQAAMTANPNVDLLFTSSDFLYPTIQGVLEPMGKWKPVGEEGHVIMGGLDGDKTACGLMNDKFVDATGVQDLYFEADSLLKAVTEAVAKGEKQPDAWLDDPGFALTQGNMAEREMDMWGCKLYHGK